MFSIVENIIKTKNKAFIAQDEEAVKAFVRYDELVENGHARHEIKRIRYLKNWSDKQGCCVYGYQFESCHKVDKDERQREHGCKHACVHILLLCV